MPPIPVPEYTTVEAMWDVLMPSTGAGDSKTPPTPAQRTTLTRKIRIASKAVDRHCGQSFQRVTGITIHLNAPALPDLQIPPAVAITSVAVNGTPLDLSDFEALPVDPTEASGGLIRTLRYVIDGVPTNWMEHPAVGDDPWDAVAITLDAGPETPYDEVVEVTEAVTVDLWRSELGGRGGEDGYGAQTARLPAIRLVEPYAAILADYTRPDGTRAPLLWELVE